MLRAIIIHGWGDGPSSHWLPWLKQQLEQQGWQVDAPAMPDTDTPVIEKWVQALAKAIGKDDEQTFLVGHSIGCQTILRYLASLPQGIMLGGTVLVAPWLKLKDDSPREEGEEEIAAPWINTPLDSGQARKHLVNQPVVILSDNDFYVDCEFHQKVFSEQLGAQVIVKEKQGHFMAAQGVTELPEAFEALMHMCGEA